MDTMQRDTITQEPGPRGGGVARRVLIASGVGVVALVAVVVWFLNRSAPAEVSIADAALQVQTDPTKTATAAGADGTIDGTWNVSTDVAGFDVNDTTGTFVGFRIAEELTGVGEVDAVGRTPDVSGSIVIDGTSLQSASFVAEVTGIVSNDARREDNIQDALEIGAFPTATFTLTSPVELGDGAAAGDVVSVDAAGQLTVHGVTRDVVVPIEAQLVGDTIVITSSFEVVFADYDVTVPSSRIVVSVDDRGPVELQLFLTRD